MLKVAAWVYRIVTKIQQAAQRWLIRELNRK